MPPFEQFLSRLKAASAPCWSAGEALRLLAPPGGGRGLILAALIQLHPEAAPWVAVVPKEEDVPPLLRDLRYFARRLQLPAGQAVTIPARPKEERKLLFADLKGQAQRLQALYHLLADPQKTALVLSAEALSQRTLPPEVLLDRLFQLRRGNDIDRKSLLSYLAENGYEKTLTVEQKGDFAVRGAIVDLFPPHLEQPLRLEFDGDLLASLRPFDPQSQRSAQEMAEATLVPLREVWLAEAQRRGARGRLKELGDRWDVPLPKRQALEETLSEGQNRSGIEDFLPAFYGPLSSLFHYLPPKALLYIDEPAAVTAALKALDEERAEEEAAARRREELRYPNADLFLNAPALQEALSLFPRAEAAELWLEEARARSLGLSPLPPLPPAAKSGTRQELRRLGLFWQSLPALREVQVVFRQEAQEKRFFRILAGSLRQGEEELGRLKEAGLSQNLQAEQFAAERGTLSRGFLLPEEGLALVSENDLFAAKELRRKPAPGGGELLTPADFHEGDFVVHLDHGIGLYRGLQRLTIGGRENDFCLLEYAGGDKLFLPVDRLNLVQKYIGGGEAKPALDRLGGNRWETAKRSASRAAEEMAEELIQLYARRKVVAGHTFPEPDDLFARFEADFPFEETIDQEEAIAATLADMQSPTPMDRLICGDVGFGKTEVAIRAAFLAVLGGKQVAVLVPTTVLAQQHYNTMSERFKRYPVRLDLLSRFRSRGEQKQTLTALAEGKVDIAIGTHRLLSKDVNFANLGLLILDEEHRFGVKHKEKIKQFKAAIDVLTLTATPIPRTLQMSMLGLRDLSVINTPPADRQAIHTAVARFDEGLIQEAVQRELARGGQIFFVHNRVESIAAMEAFLRRLLPQVRIGTAHGQMPPAALEAVMMRFLRRDIDLLLSTAIIESGLDIPSANTLIVNRADQFGLSQLYQLRGRVGRSARDAYAYLLVPEQERLRGQAQRRLAALREFTALGSGLRIALHDLEIRGAGHLLGHRQSGHVSRVGFDLYCRLLEMAVRRLKGEAVEETKDPELSLPLPAFFPETYIPEPAERLLTYKRLSQAANAERLAQLRAETEDRFGPLPATAENLFLTLSLKIAARAAGVVKVEMGSEGTALSFARQAPLDVPRLLTFVARQPKGAARLDPSGRLLLSRREESASSEIERLKKMLQDIVERV